MARSYSATSGLPHPVLIGALSLMAMAALFGGDAQDWMAGNNPAHMERWAGTNDMLAPEPPEQASIDAVPQPLMAPGFVATPSHTFVTEALVLSRQSYARGVSSRISPLDLMLGWGPMSNPAVLTHLRLRQSGRSGYASTEAGADVDLDALSPFWANVHILPASPGIAEEMAQIRAGDVVRLEGTLANVSGPDGWMWRTSTSRTDKGVGACEVLLVTAVTRL